VSGWPAVAQFLSEFVFHRSLLASPFVTTDARRASFFFVPFYSRLAHSNRSVKARARPARPLPRTRLPAGGLG